MSNPDVLIMIVHDIEGKWTREKIDGFRENVIKLMHDMDRDFLIPKPDMMGPSMGTPIKPNNTIAQPYPIKMIIHCPGCGQRHIDKGEFAIKPHHTHACQHCGFCWRPAIVPTVGVQYLPGFKDKDDG